MNLEELEVAVSDALTELLTKTPCIKCGGAPMNVELNHKYVNYYVIELVKRWRSPDIAVDRVIELANKATQRRIRKEMSAEMNQFVDRLGVFNAPSEPVEGPREVEEAAGVEGDVTPEPGPPAEDGAGDGGADGDDAGPTPEPVAPGEPLLVGRSSSRFTEPSAPDFSSSGPPAPSAPAPPSSSPGRAAVAPPECPACRSWLLPGNVCPRHGHLG